MNENGFETCRRNSWLIAAGGGVLVALMLLFIGGFGFLKALLWGVIFAVALGAFLVWAFCSRTGAGMSAPGEVGRTGQSAAVPPAKAESAGQAASVVTSPVANAASADEIAERTADAPKPTDESKAAAKPRVTSAGAKETAAGESAKKTPVKAKSSAKGKAGTKAKAGAKSKAKASPEATSVSYGASANGLQSAMAKSRSESEIKQAPEMLKQPRGGEADDLKMIKGIGPKLEKVLNEVGVWHFDQIASWKAKDIAHVDALLVGFHGRISRDGWVKQAKTLAKGEETEFSKRVSKGDVY